MNFISAATRLAGGTGAAQLIGLAAMPVLTRLYSPADFELLASYTSIAVTMGAIAALRYDIAIPIPRSASHAAALANVGFVAATFVMVMGGAITLIYWLNGWPKEGTGEILKACCLALVAAGFLGHANILQGHLLRGKRFGLIAFVKSSQMGVCVVAQFTAATIGQEKYGLMVGHVLMLLYSVLLMWLLVGKELSRFYSSSRRLALLVAHRYRKFPFYSVPESFANTAAIELPIFLIAIMAVGSEAGFAMLAMRVLSAPVALVGRSISQVYLAYAPDWARKGEIYGRTIDLIGKLAAIALVFLLIVSLLSEWLFVVVFGDDWLRAGQIAVYFAPWISAQLMVSPVSMALHILDCQRAAMVLQVFGFVLRVFGTLLAGYFISDWVVEIYALTGVIFYLVYLVVVVAALRRAQVYFSDLNLIS